LVKFCSEYLPRHPDLRSKIDALTDEHVFSTAVFQAGSEAGYDFTETEVLAVMRARVPDELGESELEAVSGGTEPKKPPPKKPSEQLYFKIELHDILITSC
jgi:hypothetical protein